MIALVSKVPSAHPFGSPWLIVEDSLRVLCLVAGIIVVFAAIAVAYNVKNRQFYGATLYGLIAVILLGASASLTGLHEIGYPAQQFGLWWRLPLNVVGLFFGALTTVAVNAYPLKSLRRSDAFREDD